MARPRVIGLVRLDEDAPRLFAATRAARHLTDLLERAFGGAQIAPLKPEVRVHHPDEGEVGEMIAFRDELRANHDVDLARFHRANELGGFLGTPDRVGGDDRGARFGE